MKRGNLRYHEWARSILGVMVFTSLLGVSNAGARRWELSSYSACSTIWLGRTDFTGVAYNPKDNILWGLTSGHDAALHAYDLDGGLVRSLRSPVPIRLKGNVQLDDSSPDRPIPDVLVRSSAAWTLLPVP
jgi:hypothetical protein